MRCGRLPRHGLLMDSSKLHAVVAGGGLAGLATALFLGRRGYQVTVVERDGHLPAGGPNSVSRPGGAPVFPKPASRTTSSAAQSGSCGRKPPTSWTR